MKHTSILFLFLGQILLAQSIKVEEKIKLSEKIDETSGVVFLDNELLTFNDSGGKPELYVLNPKTGKIKRTVKVKNATNVDWESITQDKEFVYIGDTGNNHGNRKNLVIYKVSKRDLKNKNSINAEKIFYSYANQTIFLKKPQRNNFDCESITIYKNQLYVFTKNWGDGKTNIYTLPTKKGTYHIPLINSLNINCLLTSIAYNYKTNSFIGTAYDKDYKSYILTFKDIDTKPVFHKIQLTPILGYANQVEAIAWKNNHQVYMTRESSEKKLHGKNYKRKQKLFLISLY